MGEEHIPGKKISGGGYTLGKTDLAGKILLLGVAIGILAAAWAVAVRYRSEAQNKTVQLVVDYPDANRVARSDGLPVLSVLKRFKTAGVGSLGVTEYTLEHRIRDGSVRAAAGRELLEARALPARLEPGFAELVRTRRIFPAHTYLTLPAAAGGSAGVPPPGKVEPAGGGEPGAVAYFNAIARAVQVRLRGEAAVSKIDVGGWPVLDIARDPADLADLKLGPSDRQIALARHAGLEVVPRFTNFATMTPEKFGFFLDQLPRESRLVIFSGKEVAGAPYYLDEIAAELSHRKMLFGMVEFADQAGEKALAKDLRLQVERVHSITAKEMRILSRHTAVERLVRAVRERNIRVLYFRLFPVRPGGELGSGAAPQAWLGGKGPHGSLTEYNVVYITEVVDGLKRAGYRIGRAEVFKSFRIPFWAWLGMAVGALASGFLLLRRFILLPPAWLLGLYVLGLLVSAVLLLSGRGIVLRELLALLAGVSFPALAGLRPAAAVLKLRVGRDGLDNARRDEPSRNDADDVGPATPFRFLAWREVSAALSGFWLAALISLAGALLVAGLLSDLSFMLKVDQFVGVKVLHVLPVGLVFFYVLWQIAVPSEGGRPAPPGEFWKAMISMLRRPITFEFLAWTAVAGLVGLVYILRTGNDAGLPIPGLETRFRGLLETALGARPRTKEFLIGHPAFILAVYLAVRGGVVNQRGAGATSATAGQDGADGPQNGQRGGSSAQHGAAADHRRRWLFWVAWPLLLAGVIGQLSMVNTFAHIHTPLAVSALRTALGLVFGSLIGILAIALAEIAGAPGWRASRISAGDRPG
ncbi:MAG: DUF5693 family protein [Syntrophothermus sp.]